MNADGTCERPFGPASRHLTAPAWRPGSTAAVASLRCVDLRTRAIPARNPIGLRGAGRVHVTVENDGNETATFATLTLKLVYGRGRIRAPLPSCRNASAVVCDLAPLLAGTSRTLTVDVSDQTLAGYHLQATVTARGTDSEPRTNASVAFVDVLDCDVVGTERPDGLVGTAGPDRICGLPGGDVIRAGAGNDTIRGGAGDDRIVAGPGRDVVAGDAGKDRIFARDGARDTIRCGASRDEVFADMTDRVARDCEQVVRS
jgi:Ca2+-binding RTX toxin-like protein